MAAISFLQSATSTADLTTYTFSSQNLGDAASDRHIIIAIMSRKATTAATISSVTVGGVSATISVQRTNTITNTDVAGIAIAAVPTGTTGDVVVTFSVGMLRCAIGAYRATGINATAYDSDNSVATPPAVNLDIPAGGVVVGAGLTSAATTSSWSGLTEDYDATLESYVTFTGAHDSFVSAESGRAISVSFGTTTEPVGVFASWQPISASSTTNNSVKANIKSSTTNSNSSKASIIGWYNNSWNYRVRVSILAAKVDADLTDYPVYVNLANLPAGFHSHVNQTDGRDIRITKADGITEVPREVVFYSSASDTGELHFKGDVDNDVDTYFYIYYGNSSATEPTKSDAYGAGNTWNSNFLAVFHFQETANTSADGYKDSTNNNNHGDGNSMSSAAVTGVLAGNCAVFDGVDDYIKNIPKLLTNNTWSISSFTYFHTFNGSSAGDGIFAQGTGTNTQFGGLDGASPYTKTLFGRSGGSGLGISEINVVPNVDTWYHTAATFNNTVYIPYVNGVAKTGNSSLTGGSHEDATCVLGTWYDTSAGRCLEGRLDEVRIRDDVATAAWYSTENNNLSSPNTFYSVGDEVENPLTSTTVTKQNSSKSNIKASVSDSNNSKSNIRATLLKVNSSKSSILNRITSNNSSKSDIVKTNSGVNNFIGQLIGWGSFSESWEVTIIQTSSTDNNSVKANIFKTTSLDSNSKSNIGVININSNNTKANIYRTEINNSQVKSNIVVSDSHNNSTKVSIVNTNSFANEIKSNIKYTTIYSSNVKSNIEGIILQHSNAKSNIVKFGESKNNNSKSSILITRSNDNNSRASIVVTEINNGVVKSNIKAIGVYSSSSKANVLVSNVNNYSVKSSISGVISNNVIGSIRGTPGDFVKANISFAVFSKDNSTKANIIVAELKNNEVIGNILSVIDQNNSVKASIFGGKQFSNSSIGNILVSFSHNNSVKSSILRTESSVNNSKSSLVVIESKDNSSKANIVKTSGNNSDVKANLVLTNQFINSTKSSIVSTSTNNNFDKSNIYRTELYSNYSKANIEKNVAVINSAKSNIFVTNELVQSVKSDILVLNQHNNTSKSSIVRTNSFGNETKSNIEFITEKVNSVKASIVGTEQKHNILKSNILRIDEFKNNFVKSSIVTTKTYNNVIKSCILLTNEINNSVKADILVGNSRNSFSKSSIVIKNIINNGLSKSSIVRTNNYINYIIAAISEKRDNNFVKAHIVLKNNYDNMVKSKIYNLSPIYTNLHNIYSDISNIYYNKVRPYSDKSSIYKNRLGIYKERV